MQNIQDTQNITYNSNIAGNYGIKCFFRGLLFGNSSRSTLRKGDQTKNVVLNYKLWRLTLYF